MARGPLVLRRESPPHGCRSLATARKAAQSASWRRKRCTPGQRTALDSIPPPLCATRRSATPAEAERGMRTARDTMRTTVTARTTVRGPRCAHFHHAHRPAAPMLWAVMTTLVSRRPHAMRVNAHPLLPARTATKLRAQVLTHKPAQQCTTVSRELTTTAKPARQTGFTSTTCVPKHQRYQPR